MTSPRLSRVALLSVLVGCASAGRHPPSSAFDPEQIRAAERSVISALESADPTAWVYEYTEDAILLEGDAPVVGRQALLAMAAAMKPLSSVTIAPERTEGDGRLAYVYGRASWVSGRPPATEATTRVHLVMVWRKEADGRWRVAQETLVPMSQ